MGNLYENETNESMWSEQSYNIFEGFYDNMITDNDEKNEDTEEAEKNNNIMDKNTTEKLNSHIENKNKSNNLLSEATINPEPKIINLVKNQNQDFNHVNEEEEKNSDITDNNSKENLNSQIENIHKSNDLGNKAIINHETNWKIKIKTLIILMKQIKISKIRLRKELILKL